MRINFNASAVIANNALNRNDNRLQDSLARLSSGLKVVNAKDNPSGLAMSKKMNAQIKGLDQASDNAGDGVSIIEIADGAMSEMHDILQRINELAVKGSTGTITDDDRKLIQDEVKQLKEELTRISETVEFNGQTATIRMPRWLIIAMKSWQEPIPLISWMLLTMQMERLMK